MYWTQLPDVLPEYVSSFGCAVAKFHNLEMIEGVKRHGSEEMPWMARNQRVLMYWTQLPDVLPEYVSSFGCAVAKFHNLEMIEGVKWHGSEEMPWMVRNQRVLTYWTQLPDVLPEYVSSFGCAVAKFHNLEMIEGVKWYRSEEMSWMVQNQRVVGL
ncbi:Hypp7949 [Branchiostoma lanceolatum]|uniref:Hypp7949 protein n=1 Tax=Branchiostoma lanceolatum TaxID=7740 RepID=A0A8K0EC45_BRALA|nr:Hypp7949 [Branchiostoma lanceolatum]